MWGNAMSRQVKTRQKIKTNYIKFGKYSQNELLSIAKRNNELSKK